MKYKNTINKKDSQLDEDINILKYLKILINSCLILLFLSILALSITGIMKANIIIGLLTLPCTFLFKSFLSMRKALNNSNF